MLRIAIVAPMLAGKTTFQHEEYRHGLVRSVDSDALSNHAELVTEFGDPQVTWSTAQWSAWNKARAQNIASALEATTANVVFVHSLAIAHSIGLKAVAAVLIPWGTFIIRAAQRGAGLSPSARSELVSLALANRRLVEEEILAHRIPAFSTLAQAVFWADELMRGGMTHEVAR